MFYSWQDKNLLLQLHILPNAKENKIIGIHADSLKIKINSPPVDGKANKAIIKFLASEFNVSKSSIEIISGELNRDKRVLIKGTEELPEWFSKLS